jgi:hypothetical protein
MTPLSKGEQRILWEIETGLRDSDSNLLRALDKRPSMIHRAWVTVWSSSLSSTSQGWLTLGLLLSGLAPLVVGLHLGLVILVALGVCWTQLSPVVLLVVCRHRTRGST